MKTNRSIVLALILVLCSGCAYFGIDLDTQEKQYLAARTELNVFIIEYLKVQGTVSLEDHSQAKKAIISADIALDIWESMLGKDYEPASNLQTWLDAKNILIGILEKYSGPSDDTTN